MSYEKKKSLCSDFACRTDDDKHMHDLNGSYDIKRNHTERERSVSYTHLRYQDTLSFQQLIEEETFLEEMLRKQIGAIFSEESNSERIPDRQRVEQRLNQKWIYRNGICFFEFYIKEIKKEK